METLSDLIGRIAYGHAEDAEEDASDAPNEDNAEESSTANIGGSKDKKYR